MPYLYVLTDFCEAASSQNQKGDETLKKVVRGMNYTEMVTSKGESETVQHWLLKKMRKPSQCGVWVDGEKVKGYEDMNGSDVKPGPIRLHSKELKL